ncbi:phosphoribosyltransferase family protein [Corallococcus sp. EGB]|uniref:phosphoribosyltransferase family protein n=1 Tax=Corallococcus sp. EGB TaxID=1521117 RepID=UPI001CBF1AC8|nr:phosphoribosyltransferase family protein [Corallococcus sp. EGB]
MSFEDRVDAGRRLARRLLERGYTGKDTLVLGLPCGGVPVAYEVAAALGAPLDVCVVRKPGAPDSPLKPLVDDAVCVLSTLSMFAIGQWYVGFCQVPDAEVVKLLALARSTFEQERPLTGAPNPEPPQGQGTG